MSFKHVVFDHDGTLVEVFQGKKKLFEGILEFLDALSHDSIKMYIWTARNRQSTIESLKSNGILHYFEDICTSSDTEIKPSIKGLDQMLSGIDKNKICVIGDSVTDVAGAHSFKVCAIGAVWNDPNPSYVKYLESYGADYVFESVEDCKEFVLKKDK